MRRHSRRAGLERTGQAMNFRQLSVSTRIYSGFALLIVIAMGLAGFGIDRMSEIGSQLGKLGSITDNTSRVQEATIRLEAVRRAVVRYHFDSDPAALAASQGAMTEASDLLQQLTSGTNADDRRQRYNRIREDMLSYRGWVDREVALHAQ